MKIFMESLYSAVLVLRVPGVDRFAADRRILVRIDQGAAQSVVMLEKPRLSPWWSPAC